MKKVTSFALLVFTCFFMLCITGSFIKSMPTKKSVLYAMAQGKKTPVSFFTSATSADGSTYYGTVDASGGIDESGTYVMPTEVHGMALHCLLIITFPDGTITIRMNCNMRTGNGRWQVLEGTGAYSGLKGNGPLVMPNETDEILTGTLRWN